MITSDVCPPDPVRLLTIVRTVSDLGPGSRCTVAATKSGLFSYDPKTDEISTLSAFNGLSDNDLTDMALTPDGQTLVVTYSSGNIDLIQGDDIINMPELNGWDLAEKIRAAGHDMPLVMLSGNARDQVGSEKTHHQAYLTKPVQIDQLKQCLNQLTHSPDASEEKQLLKASQTHPISLSKSQQATLQSMADIGHISGILKKIEEWHQQQQIGIHSFNSLKSAANSYQIQRIKDLLNHAQN